MKQQFGFKLTKVAGIVASAMLISQSAQALEITTALMVRVLTRVAA